MIVAVHQIISDEITETIAPKCLPFAQGQRVSILGRLIQILEHLPHPFHPRGRRLQTRHRRIFPNLTKETHRPRRDRIHTNLPADIKHPPSNVQHGISAHSPGVPEMNNHMSTMRKPPNTTTIIQILARLTDRALQPSQRPEGPQTLRMETPQSEGLPRRGTTTETIRRRALLIIGNHITRQCVHKKLIREPGNTKQLFRAGHHPPPHLFRLGIHPMILRVGQVQLDFLLTKPRLKLRLLRSERSHKFTASISSQHTESD